MARTKQTVRRAPISAEIQKRSLGTFEPDLNNVKKQKLNDDLNFVCRHLTACDKTCETQSKCLKEQQETIGRYRDLVDEKNKTIVKLRALVRAQEKEHAILQKIILDMQVAAGVVPKTLRM